MKRALLLLIMSTCMVPVAAQAVTFRVATVSPAISFAAPFARDEGGGLRGAFYDSLTLVTTSGDLRPALALSWTNETETRWVFTLRQDVAFWNGERFDAQAAAAAITNLIDPKQRFGRALDVPGIREAKARDDFTLEVTTLKPDPLLPRRLNMVPIPAPKAWSDLGPDAFAKAPVGTGPFKIAQWGAAGHRLEAVSTSWRKSKHVSIIQTTIIPDAAARIKALLSDRVDVALGLGPDDLEQVKAAGYEARVTPITSVLSIAYRTVREDAAPLKDVRVRHALNYAVDKDSIVRQILSNTTRAATQGTVPGVPGYNPDIKPYPYDPAKAKRLLAEAGYPKGFKMVTAVYGGLLPNDTTIFQKVAQDLAAVGVEVELRSMTFADYARRLFNADWQGIDAFSNGWLSVGLGDPSRAIEQFSCAYSAPFFCEPTMMPLIEAARIEMNPDKRDQLLRNVMSAFNDNGVALWLVEFSIIAGLSPRVENFRLRDGLGIDYETVGFKAP